MSFKLLAIRPLKKCDSRFLKNLKEDKIYQFYNEYIFKTDDNGEVISIENKSSVSKNLYDVSPILKVNISALVGKNGSGKSSLLEFFYAACFVIASKEGILDNPDKIDKDIEDIKTSDYLNEDEISKVGEKISEIKNQHSNKKFNIEFNYDTENKVRERLEERKKEIEKIYKDLKVEIYYEIDKNYHKIKIFNRKIEYTNLTNKNNEFEFSNFFYSIAINYSLYGLNEEFLGEWISALFHKNDGYQTPLVINPYRISGNINVNSELHLAQTRLMTNILLTDNKEVLVGKEIEKVIFEIDPNKFNDERINELAKKADISLIYKHIYDEEISNPEKTPNYELLKNYIVFKIEKICRVYKDYQGINPFDDKKEISKEVLEKLKKDKSHITLKLRQVLNLVRFDFLKDDSQSKWNKEKGIHRFEIQIDKLFDRINEENIKNISKEELIPIGCHRFTIKIKNDKNKDSSSEMSTLSSGEQHLVHTTQSVLYHILNVNSVHNSVDNPDSVHNSNSVDNSGYVDNPDSVDNSDSNKKKYHYINVIFDEIELYFHPEYQRRFVFELLEKLKKLKNIEGIIDNINGINILFCTHSPFILSDIPKQNVLFLGEGKIENKNTFAGNISMMLSSSFFMTKSLIGEFAKNRINQLLEKLNQQKEEYRKEEEDKKKTNKKEEDKYKAQIIMSDKEKSEALELIKLIDEPILKYKLNEMFCEAYPNFCKENEKKIRENELKALAEQYGFKIEIKK